MTERTLDLRGLKCPLPALRARKALSAAGPGEVIVVECTDPLARIDIPHMVRETGNIFDGCEDRGEVILFRLRKRVP